MQDTKQQGVDCPNCGNELVWESYRHDDPADSSFYHCYEPDCNHGIVRYDGDGKLHLVSRKAME